jgi:hypothetical protein
MRSRAIVPRAWSNASALGATGIPRYGKIGTEAPPAAEVEPVVKAGARAGAVVSPRNRATAKS